jgi:hypothetical protein
VLKEAVVIGRDNSECPGYGTVCPEWHHHQHCALCGFILVAQSDGCGGLEGFGPDANAVECEECERYSCPECARNRGGKTLCYDCNGSALFGSLLADGFSLGGAA